MIRGMTSFSWRVIKGYWGSATWELRSVNQRYLEIFVHLPEQFRGLEPIIIDRIRLHVTRGKVDCNLRFDVNSGFHKKLVFNYKLAKQLLAAAQWIKEQSREAKIDSLAILSWPGVMVAMDHDLDDISTNLLSGFEDALNDFIDFRETEGKALKMLIEHRLTIVSVEINKVRQQIPLVLILQRQRLLNKFEEARIQLDVNRLEQELVILAQRIDVSEELDRLDTYVKEIHHILTKKEPVGRRLDFMMQELNREANTLAAKSINAKIMSSAVELKVLIAQMREQIQNIE